MNNETHQPKTYADSRLSRNEKTASELRLMLHVLSHNHHGLIAIATVTAADRHAEDETAKVMINAVGEAVNNATINVTLRADEGHDTEEIIDARHKIGIPPHLAKNTPGRCSPLPDAIATTTDYEISQNKRKLIDELLVRRRRYATYVR